MKLLTRSLTLLAACMIGWMALPLTSAGSVTTDTDTTYAKTRYPIVLVHGLAGFSRIGNVGYWYKIPEDLRAHGAIVYVADVSAFNSNEVRGEQLLRQVRALLAATGATKVNLIGHSQGGQTSRYVAAVAPELVASVTTIGSPHKGSGVADYVSELPPATVKKIVNGANALGYAVSLVIPPTINGRPSSAQDGMAALIALTTAGAASFNLSYPSKGLPATCNGTHAETEVRNGNLQYLYSWAGNKPVTTGIDPTDAAMLATSKLMREPANDGLVSVCSAQFGKILGTYPWNHADEINQLFGMIALAGPNPVLVIRTHANRLKLAGL